ncbi:MAG: HAD-IIB family hydrolase [Meiothermus sp.]|uniref:HAD family hydrolase n=1 Tax=Meiothermus sp. TaxID=1955249 RepID=UPI0025E2BAA7|nr:HAD-IIB family hydrolase [Meiothermus sp.]MCS7058314.1 HAD-IIB family hydrolase [Meiothermus sp.]MCS7194813.1 HAD-IIB family hydrolase [Meiothermus sp.]MCX7740982.1 HAD-IIB family hydrolase [Meiothermus sp.]MDW8090345.1 HAD-IIB family hydrolase [Meiothermus sp.]MDW8481156.1 HAD-IIB family hydrolase [Meiothermus sp.]
MSRIQLVLIDVDGTLLGPSGVPECAWEAAQQARQAGLHLSLCTGRPGRGFALEYAKRLDPQGFHVFESGAVVVSGQGETVRASGLPEKAYARLLELSRRHRIPFEVYTAQGGFYRESSHPDLHQHEAMLGFAAEELPLDRVPGEVIRVQYVWRPSPAWEAVRQGILEIPGIELHEATSPGMPGVGFSSVTAAGVSKRSAAEWVARRLGLSLAQAAMVGDGENDLELIEAAGLGIAMGNAPEKVRRTARRVVKRVEECGLAEALALAWGLK